MRPASNDELPLVLLEDDFAVVLRSSVRTVQRLKRAKKLPEPLPLPGRPRWARDAILVWLSAGSRRRKGS